MHIIILWILQVILLLVYIAKTNSERWNVKHYATFPRQCLNILSQWQSNWVQLVNTILWDVNLAEWLVVHHFRFIMTFTQWGRRIWVTSFSIKGTIWRLLSEIPLFTWKLPWMWSNQRCILELGNHRHPGADQTLCTNVVARSVAETLLECYIEK